MQKNAEPIYMICGTLLGLGSWLSLRTKF